MEAKQKAKKLIDKFTFASIYFTNNTDGAKLNAKTCALIAVEEIINELRIRNGSIKYWNEVKEEINKL